MSPDGEMKGSKSSIDLFVPLNVQSTANMPVDQEGRLYHLVGDPRRAYAIAELMDGFDPVLFSSFDGSNDSTEAMVQRYPHVKIHISHRGFVTITGKFKGCLMSVIAIGMGPAMMDFFVREAREIIDGVMYVIRFGTCGSINPDHGAGNFAVNSKGAVLVQRNPDHFQYSSSSSSLAGTSASSHPAYRVSRPWFPDEEITKALIKFLSTHAKDVPVVNTMNATCDSFYSSQGRPERDFMDKNDTLLEELKRDNPEISTLDMETCHLFHLSACIKDKVNRGIRSSALKIIVANRTANTFLMDEDVKRRLEKTGGLACLETLRHFITSQLN